MSNNITQMLERTMMAAELGKLDGLYEGMAGALAQQYQKARADIHTSYGVEEEKPVPEKSKPDAGMGTDDEIPMNPAAHIDTRRGASLGVVPGRG